MPLFIMTDYQIIKRQKAVEVLERFKQYPTRTLARVLFTEAPELFISIDNARCYLRYYRGKHGEPNRRRLKMRDYVQPL